MIRLGFIYTHNEEIFQRIYENLPIWNLNSFADHYMEIALKFRGELELSFQKAKEDRKILIELLNQINSNTFCQTVLRHFFLLK